MKADLDSARARFRKASVNCEINDAKISHGNAFFSISNSQQRSNAIKSKKDEIQKGLNSCKTRLATVKPSFDDLVNNFDDLSKVRDTYYNTAYKTIYNDDQDEFEDDNNGGAKFNLGRYIQKVFGFGQGKGNNKNNNSYDPLEIKLKSASASQQMQYILTVMGKCSWSPTRWRQRREGRSEIWAEKLCLWCEQQKQFTFFQRQSGLK